MSSMVVKSWWSTLLIVIFSAELLKEVHCRILNEIPSSSDAIAICARRYGSETEAECVDLAACPGLRDTTDYRVLAKYMCGFVAGRARVCCPKSSDPLLSANTFLGQQQCGLGNVSLFAGGPLVKQESKPGALPWIAGLVRNEDDKLFCEGVLLSNRMVLTAASCLLDEKQDDTIRNPSTYFVRLGEHDLSVNEFFEAEYPIEQVIPHPGFHSTSRGNNDLALIRLKLPVEMDEFIQPVCLPASKSDSESNTSSGSAPGSSASDASSAGFSLSSLMGTALTAGWRASNPELNGANMTLNKVLQLDSVTVLPPIICTSVFRKFTALEMDDEHKLCGLTSALIAPKHEKYERELRDEELHEKQLQDQQKDPYQEYEPVIQVKGDVAMDTMTEQIITTKDSSSASSSLVERSGNLTSSSSGSADQSSDLITPCVNQPGSPLFMLNYQTHRFTLIGILPRTSMCGTSANPLPVVYTKLSPYLDWVRSHL